MRRFFSNTLIAATAFIYGIVSIYGWALFSLPSVQPSSQEVFSNPSYDREQLKPVRQPLNPSFLNLSDKERDGLAGPVRQVRQGIPVWRSRRSAVQCGGFRDAVTYDVNGKRIEKKSDYFVCGNRDPVKEFYDERGNLVKQIWYDTEMRIRRREIFSYDEKDRWIEYSRFDGDDNLVEKDTYQYESDSYGNWIRRNSSGRLIECREILYYRNRAN